MEQQVGKTNLDQNQGKEKLGTRIRNRRKELGLSQKEVVTGGYSVPYLSRVEQNQLEPTRQFLEFIAPRLKTSVAELTGTEHEPGKKRARPTKKARAAQEYALMNAYIALQAKQFPGAKKLLEKVDLQLLAPGLLARYYAIRGELEVELKEYEQALEDLTTALHLFESRSGTPALELERIRNWIGLVYYYQNKEALAIEQHLLCLRAIQEGKVNDRRFKMKILSNLANEYHGSGNSTQALLYYREAVKLAEEGEDDLTLANTYWGMGLAHRSLQDFSLAKLYLNLSGELYEKLRELKLASTVRGILGMLMVERQEYDQAVAVLDNALALATGLNDPRAQCIAYINLAYLYKEQDKPDEAEQNAILALTNARRTEDKHLIGQGLVQLAKIKLVQGDTEEGFKLFDEAITTLEETDMYEYLKRFCFDYAAALEKAGRLAESLALLKKAYYYLDKSQKKSL